MAYSNPVIPGPPVASLAVPIVMLRFLRAVYCSVSVPLTLSASSRCVCAICLTRPWRKRKTYLKKNAPCCWNCSHATAASWKTKRTDAASVSRKRQAWEKIEDEFNYRHNVTPRKWIQLKKCWENLKDKWRRTNAEDMRERFATGKRCFG